MFKINLSKSKSCKNNVISYFRCFIPVKTDLTKLGDKVSWHDFSNFVVGNDKKGLGRF